MSGWDSYITGASGLLNRGPIESAGIYGLNGALWAQHNCNATQDEIAFINSIFEKPATGYAAGFSLGGKKYTLIRVDDLVLHGKGKIQDGGTANCLTIQKTGQALVIAIGKEDANGGQVSVAVGTIGDYLVSVGY